MDEKWRTLYLNIMIDQLRKKMNSINNDLRSVESFYQSIISELSRESETLRQRIGELEKSSGSL